jgi:threonine-phosphate decarboxylase
MAFIHGGNIYEVAERMGVSPEAVLDFSASINPLGPPPHLLDQFNQYFNRLQHYPDIHNRSLTEAIAEFHGKSTQQIVTGNGSTELIYALPRALHVRRALIVLPTFSEYQRAFASQNVELIKIFTAAESCFQPTVEQLARAVEEFQPDAVLLTHPGSPSGVTLPSAVRSWLVQKGREGSFHLIIDEVFADFCEEESLKGLLDELDQLVIIRSMTKFYGIPGLRLGYLMTSESIANKVRHLLPPWSVNTYAQIAGAYCLEQRQYRARSLAFMDGERKDFIAALQRLEGCRAYPGKANYVLVELDSSLPKAAKLQMDLLLSDRILIRDCSSFEGMGERHVRFAIRLPHENKRLLEAFDRWLAANRGA